MTFYFLSSTPKANYRSLQKSLSQIKWKILTIKINRMNFLTKLWTIHIFWNLFSTFFSWGTLPHFAAVHSKSLFLVPTNRESKTAFS